MPARPHFLAAAQSGKSQAARRAASDLGFQVGKSITASFLQRTPAAMLRSSLDRPCCGQPSYGQRRGPRRGSSLARLNYCLEKPAEGWAWQLQMATRWEGPPVRLRDQQLREPSPHHEPTVGGPWRASSGRDHSRCCYAARCEEGAQRRGPP